MMGSNVTISSTAAAGRSPIGRTGSNLLAAMLLLTGLVCSCAKDLAAVEGTPSEAFDRHLETSLGRLFEEAAVKHPGQSGFTIIRHGRPAFTARVAFADLAQQSLDLQYYIWEEVRFRTDPHSSFWARMVSGFIAWLPVEHQL
jgi:hypothetical protein